MRISIPVLSFVVLASLVAPACDSRSDCGEGTPLTGLEPTAFHTAPEIRQDDPRIVRVAPEPGALNRALAEARPGDLIEVLPGTHVVGREGLTLRASGTPERWIRIRGAAEGSRPTIDLDGRSEFRVAGSYVALEGLAIVHGKGNNLHIAPADRDVENVVVRDCVIRDLEKGPGAAIKINRNNNRGTAVDLVYIEGCDLSGAKKNAIVDGVGVTRAVVRGCFLHDNEKGSSGIFFKGGSADVLIEGNVVARIRGNSAVKLGGSTASRFFHPDYPEQEGVRQVARNNFVVDCDDSVFEIRGVRGCRVVHNTVVSQTGFVVFRLQKGHSVSGEPSDNDDVEIANNLVIATGGDPQYARNDAGPGRIRFRSNAWVGTLHDSGSAGPGVPRFPCVSDVVVPADGIVGVLHRANAVDLGGLPDAIDRYAPVPGSAIVGKGTPTPAAREDAGGRGRPPEAPTIGALEPARD